MASQTYLSIEPIHCQLFVGNSNRLKMLAYLNGSKFVGAVTSNLLGLTDGWFLVGHFLGLEVVHSTV